VRDFSLRKAASSAEYRVASSKNLKTQKALRKPQRAQRKSKPAKGKKNIRHGAAVPVSGNRPFILLD
jgi:hypothetical protein